MNMNFDFFTKESLFNATIRLFRQWEITLIPQVREERISDTKWIKQYLGENYKNSRPYTDIKAMFVGVITDSALNLATTDNNPRESDVVTDNKRYHGLIIVAVELGQIPNRSQIAELTRTFNREFKENPVGLVLKYENKISIAITERSAYQQGWRDGEKVGKVIILRDINVKKPHAGHLRILEGLAKRNAKNFNELHTAWLKVLNIKTLNNEFYDRLVKWYDLCFNDIEIDLTTASQILNKKIDDELKPQAVIRVIVRLMFIWFMKEKGLIKQDFFSREFAKEFLKNKDTYYNAILQNLFFGVLNKNIHERRFRKHDNENRYDPKKNDYGILDVFRFQNFFRPEKAEEFLDLTKKTIPFVNGGLFTCHDYIFAGRDSITNKKNASKNYIIDGFSERNGHRARISDDVVFELIDLFKDFVFTIEESTPTEQDIALDPELLGTVFEQLIDFYNPETKGSARNSTGSFYTPREIVDYMCCESLKESLKTRFPKLHTQIDKLIDNNEDYLDFPDKNKIIAAITDLKILDPACGSGAFPMGMFHVMVRTVEKLQERKTTYQNKLDIIKQCIYGVDIQNIAVEISKLRFFISLLVDCPKHEHVEDFDVLPNLETKFIVANTLIGINLEDSGDVFVEFLKEEFERLTEIFLLFTTADTPAKKEKIKNDFNKKKETIINDSRFEASTEIKENIRAWNPFNICYCSPFFHSQVMFGVKDGFDVVIGNPPYVSTKGVSDKDKKLFEKEYGFSDDTYSHFFFKGCKLLAKNGGLTYITPKTFWTTQTKRNLRDLLLSKTINYIFDTANPFEASMVDTCITSIQNRNNQNNKIKFLDGSKDISDISTYTIDQDVYLNTQNSVIFKPTSENLRIYELYNETVKKLYDKWWDKISTSKNIEKNKKELDAYRKNLKPGDIALLGCLTDGGVGLQTGNNGKYIAVRKSTKWAKNILVSRPKKLAEAIKAHKIQIPGIKKFANVSEYLNSLKESQIVDLFDKLKEQYGRDIFGQGYIYRLIDDSEIADVDTLTEKEKENGISEKKKHYVPYDKGDKDGNRWYLETPFAIAWTQKNVGFLRADPKARYQGYMFYFKEGFCWSDINTTFLKCRKKQKSINDVKSMSLYALTEKVPEFFIVSIINSTFVSYYVNDFVNNTQTFQINDARQLPIIIPTKEELRQFEKLFCIAIATKQKQFSGQISEDKAETMLFDIQKKLDQLVIELYSI